MSDEPLPCPFCGSTKIELHICPSCYFLCEDCGGEGPWNDDSDSQALTEWNTRSPAWRTIESAKYGYIYSESEEDTETILMYSPTIGVFMGRATRYEGKCTFTQYYHAEVPDVTHWMAIPEAPVICQK